MNKNKENWTKNRIHNKKLIEIISYYSSQSLTSWEEEDNVPLWGNVYLHGRHGGITFKAAGNETGRDSKEGGTLAALQEVPRELLKYWWVFLHKNVTVSFNFSFNWDQPRRGYSIWSTGSLAVGRAFDRVIPAIVKSEAKATASYKCK